MAMFHSNAPRIAIVLAGGILGASGLMAEDAALGRAIGPERQGYLGGVSAFDMEAASPLSASGCTLLQDGSMDCPDGAMIAADPPWADMAAEPPDTGAEAGTEAGAEWFDIPRDGMIMMSADAPMLSAEPFAEGRATRTFAGPGEYPPEQFGAYAVVAFKSGPTSVDRDRYLMICEAFVSTIPEASADEAPELQLVTVWPVDSDAVAAEIRSLSDDRQVCELAVDHYDVGAAREAIRDARAVDPDIWAMLRRSKGPFLLAWNPGASKGQPDTLILRISLGNVNQMAWAKDRFEFWVEEIERNPQLWLDGWQEATIRERVAMWADDTGVFLIDFLLPED